MSVEEFETTRFETMRASMVASQLRPNGVDDPRLVAAMGVVAREAFVPAPARAIAYADTQIPLGGGRVLNTPMVTGRLLAAAAVEPGERVLLVGAGTGYSAAVLTKLGAAVVAVETEAGLVATLQAEVPGVDVVEGQLTNGAAALAPFDVILIDGAVETVPAALVAQLAEGGRLVAGLVDGGPTRLAAGRKIGGMVKLVPFGDADIAVLPQFARPPAFVF